MNVSLTNQLRKATRKEHAYTESKMNAKSIFSQKYTLKEYHDHLLQLYKAHCLVNEYINFNQIILPNQSIVPKDRREDLRIDLYQINNKNVELKYTIKDLSLFRSLPKLLGLMYVVKGSELGGSIIGKKIEEHRLSWKIAPARFYNLISHDQLIEDWKQWCKNINQLADSEKFIQEAIDSAKIAFSLFTNPEKFAEFRDVRPSISSLTA